MTRFRRIRARLLVVFTTLVLLELVLQAGALFVWTFGRTAAAATSGERVVLCTGDSYTYGLGSSSPAEQSYPAQLEQILNQKSAGWRVANCGWPGQNSWDVLRKLDGQLQQFRPSFVYILVGVNDFWSQPELHRLDEGSAASSESFTWTWRTGRLVALLRGMFLPNTRIARDAAQLSAAFPAGHWTLEGMRLHFAEDGRLTFGDTSLGWSSTGNELRIGTGGSADIRARWSLDADRLTLALDAIPLVVVLRPCDAVGGACSVVDLAPPAMVTPDPVVEGWRAWRAGELDKAEIAFKEALAKSPGEPTLHGYLAMTYASAGRTKDVDEQLAFVRASFDARRDDQAAVETYAGALASAGKGDEAVRIAKEQVTRFPKGSILWGVVANASDADGDSAGARHAVERAIELESWPERRAYLHRTRAAMLVTVDPLEAARSVVLARVNNLDRNLTVQMLQWARNACTEENITRVCDELALSAPLRDDIMALHRASVVPASGPVDVWRAHIRQAIARCKAAGAVPVIVTYPFSQELEGPMESLAQDAGAGFIRLSAEFARATAGEGGAAFYSAEGHPNEKGYALMARLVAEDVLRR